MLHGRQWQQQRQQVMLVGKRKLGAVVVMVDGMVQGQVEVEHLRVDLVLPPVEGEE